MIITDVSDRVSEGRQELAATVEFEGRPRLSRRVWLRRPTMEGPPAPAADPLFAAFLIPCMALGEDLEVRSPVSRDLRQAALESTAPVLLRWFPQFRPVHVFCPSPASDFRSCGGATACLFSGGVDSYHAFERHRHRISHLVHIHGFDIRSTDRERWGLAHGHVREIARDRGKEVLPVSTNIQEVALHEVRLRLERRRTPFFPFDVRAYFGSFLVAVGLSLRPLLGGLIVPSSFRFDHPDPEASHRLMEPSWSTPSLRIELKGDDVDRLEKIEELARTAPDALERLRVCIRRWGSAAGHLNCGTCLKCVRLRLELRACGIPDGVGSFAERPDLRRIRDTHATDRSHFWRAILDRAAGTGDEDLRAVAEVVMGKRIHAARIRKYLRSAGMAALDRLCLFYRTKLLLDRVRTRRGRRGGSPCA